MKMKNMTMSLLLLAAMPLPMAAQDDLYFVPTKENVAKEAETWGMPKNTYYAGSSRNVDEYNRQVWSKVTPIDSTGNDIIDFSAVRGVYPDSAYTTVNDNDYKYTKRMSRFEGYTPADAYWEGYRDGSWMSPWRYSYSYWYWDDPWYWDSPWYRPVYYHTWYSPWHYGYYHPWHYRGWYGGYYGTYWRGGGRYVVSRPIRRTTYSSGRTFGTRIDGGRSSSYSNRSFGSMPSTRGYSGSSFGGGRSSGGGSFGGGGGRSVSGGRSFGGRR